jgi:hypothetical protein
MAFSAKILAIVAVTNAAGASLYAGWQRRRRARENIMTAATTPLENLEG